MSDKDLVMNAASPYNLVSVWKEVFRGPSPSEAKKHWTFEPQAWINNWPGSSGVWETVIKFD